MERTRADVDRFLSSLPEQQGADMAALDAIISEYLGGRERELWEGVFWGGTEQSIIGYARIEQPRPKGPAVEWFLVGLALQKNHLSIYVNAAADGQYLTKKYAARLGKVKVGAAAITTAALDRLELDALRELLAEAFASLD